MFNPSQLALPISISLAALVGCSSSTNTIDVATCLSPASLPEEQSSISGLTLLGSFVSDSPFDSSAAEIVHYDVCRDQLFVVNAQNQSIDVLSLDKDNRPAHKATLNLDKAKQNAQIEIGAANSVATYNGLVAVAIENKNKQLDGIVAIYQSDNLSLLATYPTGALPDMVSFSPDGRYIATANEGEPNSDYSNDPEGSVTLIDLAPGVKQAKVSQISFKEFNVGNTRNNELSEQVRISAPNATVAQDLEPEYLAFDENGKLFVALQENNALAKIDIASQRVDAILPLGYKRWGNAQLDASNKDNLIGNFTSYDMLVGLYMPDSIDTYQVDGETFIVSANEGDGREYGFKTTQAQCDKRGFDWDEDDYSATDKYDSKQGFCIAYSDELRGKKLDVPRAHPLHDALEDKKKLGRLKVIAPNEDLQSNSSIESFGSRSFSIWNANGEQVFDSGDQFAQIVYGQHPLYLNSSNDSNQSADDRSDDKGVEPEAIEVATINGRQYAFIGLERQGGVMIYDISNPTDAMFLHYSNNRDFTQPVCTQIEDGECANGRYNPKAGDLGPESIHYFTRNGQHLLAVGNEVSGTTTLYRIDL